MTRIAEYPEEITDALAWRTEVGIVAYRDGKLDLLKLAAFLDMTPLKTYGVLRAHGLDATEAEFLLAQELDGVAGLRAQSAATVTA